MCHHSNGCRSCSRHWEATARVRNERECSSTRRSHSSAATRCSTDESDSTENSEESGREDDRGCRSAGSEQRMLKGERREREGSEAADRSDAHSTEQQPGDGGGSRSVSCKRGERMLTEKKKS